MHPYTSLDAKAYWATAVAKKGAAASLDLWSPKFVISREDRIATFGSCFAQHFGRALRERDFNWSPFEQAPAGLSVESRKTFNYDVFSARTGNIYTPSMLRQWVGWALDKIPAPEEIWQRDGRFYDPFRPAIEPEGFASKAEVLASRELTLNRFAAAMQRANVLVFTLGLTESWFNTEHGYEYPVCPGTVAGDFDETQNRFVNQDYPSIRAALAETLARVRTANPKLRVLLTVSPVPLTATMSGNHVLVATMESKSILRAVAGSLAREHAFVDYFPSYEIINSPVFRGAFFESNQRSVAREGVDTVMACFFTNLHAKFGIDVGASIVAPPSGAAQAHAQPLSDNGHSEEEDVACEEALLEAFAPKTQG